MKYLLRDQTFEVNCATRSGVCECCFSGNGRLLTPNEQLCVCIAPVGYLKYRKQNSIYCI